MCSWLARTIARTGANAGAGSSMSADRSGCMRMRAHSSSSSGPVLRDDLVGDGGHADVPHAGGGREIGELGAVHAQPPPDRGHEPLELGLGGVVGQVDVLGRGGRRRGSEPVEPRQHERAGDPGIAFGGREREPQPPVDVDHEQAAELAVAADAPVGEAECGEGLSGRILEPGRAACRGQPTAERGVARRHDHEAVAAAEPLGQVAQHLGARVAVAVSLDGCEHHGSADDQVVDRDQLAGSRRQLE